MLFHVFVGVVNDLLCGDVWIGFVCVVFVCVCSLFKNVLFVIDCVMLYASFCYDAVCLCVDFFV